MFLTLAIGRAYDVCVIVDSAIYVDGHRAAEPASLAETYEACREQHGLAWLGLYEPTDEEFSSVAEEFGLHPLAVEDAIEAHQRPKIEHYEETVFVVLRPARYVDETETIEFGEIARLRGSGLRGVGAPRRGLVAGPGAQGA